MLISLTVGKLDAGLAILLTEDKRLIEFPSILLPPGITSGSIVDIQVSRNIAAETSSKASFSKLQGEIYNAYGVRSPSKPVLRLRNATQTSIVLEWDPIELATATLRSLTLYRNNAKAGSIPNPTAHTSTKISGLAVGEEYTFHLVLRTSAGTYSSEKVTARTHKLTDLSGITVCPGVMSAEIREQVEASLSRIGARPLQDSVRIDTTHFVCTEGRGQAWEKAVEMNIPVVRPEWIEACENEGRIVVARNFYLGVDIQKMRQSMPPPRQPQTPVTPSAPQHSPRLSVASPETTHTPEHKEGSGEEGPAKSERSASIADSTGGRSEEKLGGNDGKKESEGVDGAGDSGKEEDKEKEDGGNGEGGEKFDSVPL
ncbi:hypothetical protein BZA05DRAFT_407137 [Tricharina praecox]|uniref:uncharacterized protein n=1 Tax=Tricharina praecox TaxID=43433 RepID=UPI00221F677A|nr:uncharacterized protein BZA05DRAFT_407137 [Tricharina praecox]KAI5846174.1 hypothetical protein BZA05DRAFT_407137 [Tricharina praecox]